MKNNPLSLEASSPEELSKALISLSEKEAMKPRFMVLNIYGTGVLVRQFELPRLNLRELKRALELEAVDLLHICADEVEFDYQLLSSTPDKIKGVFIAASRKLVEEYLASCDKAGFIPLKMTASVITAASSFLHKNKINTGSFCLLDFRAENRINLAVFDNSDCVLLREIHYENLNEAGQKVIDSLKYSCARSVCKRLEEVYLSGDSPDKDALVARLQKEFEVTPRQGDFTDISSGASNQGSLSKLNLFKKYAVPLSLRNGILAAENIAIAVCLFACLALGVKIIKENLLIKNLRSSFKTADYDYGSRLLEKTKFLKNAK